MSKSLMNSLLFFQWVDELPGNLRYSKQLLTTLIVSNINEENCGNLALLYSLLQDIIFFIEYFVTFHKQRVQIFKEYLIKHSNRFEHTSYNVLHQ